jgi:hypothetical protein
VPFESLNVRDGAEGERRWRASGRPPVPSLSVDGRLVSVLHVSQIAQALGLPPPTAARPLRDARDAGALLDAWLAAIRTTAWPQMLEPTSSRGRSLRNLTVNVFHPFRLLADAWHTAMFDWHPERDDQLEGTLGDKDALIRFAEAIAGAWRLFLVEHADDLDRRDPLVDSSRGRLSFHALLAFQRWHAAYHYRQLAATLAFEPELLDRLPDLALPAEIF